MNYKSKYFVLLFLVFSVFIAQSCSNEAEDDELKNKEIQAVKVFSDKSYILPSPLQIAKIFKKAGLIYSPELLNPTENLNKYNTQITRALALGTYSADITYCVINQKSQESFKYLNTIKKLTDDLGMSSAFSDDNFFERFEQNITNEDSLYNILEEFQIRFDDYFVKNEDQQLAVLIFSGAWLESMNFGVFSSQDNASKAVAVRLAEQYLVLNNLLKAIKMNQKDKVYDELIADFEEINKSFENFNFIKSGGNNKEEESLREMILTEEEVNTLSRIIKEKRGKVINGEY